MKFYGDTSRSLEKCIELSALSRTERDKRHAHQRRIRRGLLEEVRSQLLKMSFESATNFDDHYNRIMKAIRIKGIAEATVYDVSHRLAARLGLEPEYVYLHAGTRGAARDLDRRGDKLSISELPIEFRKLSPSEAEDCLCRYKDDIRRIASRLG
jgi:hypothetical protein